MPIRTAYDLGVLTSSAARRGKARASAKQVPSRVFNRTLVMKIDPFDWTDGMRQMPWRYRYSSPMAFPSQCRYARRTLQRVHSGSFQGILAHGLSNSPLRYDELLAVTLTAIPMPSATYGEQS